MKDVKAPDGFMFISDAIARLANAMWGGLRRPVPVQVMKRTYKRASIGSGPWREQAGQRLRTAAMDAELAVYVAPNRGVEVENRYQVRHPLGQNEPTLVPTNVVRRLIPTFRGSLPDQPIRPSIKTVDGDQNLFALLISGLLVIRASDFEVWYRCERAKGKWASQRSRLKTPSGRPTKQTDALSSAVLALVHDGTWSGKASIAQLHRQLINSGRGGIPSPDTLARLVDQLHSEIGEPELLRIAHVRRKRR